MNAAAIAQHLNIAESAIIRIEEWANVLFVVCRKLGARFVSKKVLKMETIKLVFNYHEGSQTYEIPAIPGIHEFPHAASVLSLVSYAVFDGEKVMYCSMKPKTSDFKALGVARMGKKVKDGVAVIR